MAPRALAAVACALATVGGAGCGSSSVSSVTSPSVVQRCQTTVSAPTPAFGPNGGTGTATVGAPRECPWTASTQAGWITIMPPGSGQGDGSVAFRVGENPDPIPRQGTLVVSDGSVELSQAAAPCAFTLGSNTDVVGAEGGTLSIDVRTNAACSWTASTDAPWATPSPESGKGTQTVRVAVAPNSGPERSARATIASQQLTFSQRSLAAPAPAPLPRHPAPTPTLPSADSDTAGSDTTRSGTTRSGTTHAGTTTPAPRLRHHQRRHRRRRYLQLRRHRLRHRQLRRRSRSPAKSSRVRGCVPT